MKLYVLTTGHDGHVDDHPRIEGIFTSLDTARKALALIEARAEFEFRADQHALDCDCWHWYDPGAEIEEFVANQFEWEVFR